MKIKIKIKSLILITLATVFIVLIVVPFTTLEIAKYLDKKGSDKAAVFYESYLSKAIKPSESEALYKYVINMIGGLDKYYLMSNFGGGDMNNVNMETMEKAISYLETILEKSDSSLRKDAYKTLLDISIATLKQDKLLDWITWGKDKDSKISYISDIYEAYYLFTNRKYESANKLLDKYEIGDRDYMYYFMKAYIAEFMGDFPSAKRYYEMNSGWEYEDIMFGRPIYDGRRRWSNNYEGRLKGENKVRGTITYNGKPMPFVEVYMNEELNSFSSSMMNFVGVTDMNGEYETVGLKKGKYNIGVGLNNSILFNKVYKGKPNRILELEGDMVYNFEFVDPIKVTSPKNNELITKDKFTVEWEEVKNADYYIVEMTSFTDENKTGSIRYAIPDINRSLYISDTNAIFDINVLKNYIAGTSHDGEERIITPYSILGSIRPNMDLPITVTAYDKDRNVLGSSLPIKTYYENLPSIIVPGEFSEGEKLILNGKHEEAIKFYEDILKNEPDNLEALRYLIKYYMMSWKMDNYDFDKAIIYADRYSSITGDDSFIKETVGYMDYPSLVKHKDFIKDFYSKVSESEMDTDYYWQLGRFYTALGDIEKARSKYENMQEYFIDVSILEFDLYLKDIDKAVERLKGEDFNTNLMNKNILLNAISKFDENVLNSNDYKIFKELLEDSIMRKYKHEEMQSRFFDAYKRIKNHDIKRFLDEWQVENYWTIR